MPAQQMPLIPVSPTELTQAGFDLALLLQQEEDEDATFDEVKTAHKETKAALKKGIKATRALIDRARHERDEGLTHAQVDALLWQAEERLDAHTEGT